MTGDLANNVRPIISDCNRVIQSTTSSKNDILKACAIKAIS